MLPYQDTKPEGAADFYLAINATFRFIHRRLGEEGWIEYLRHLAETYFRPVTQVWAEQGLPAVAAYWRSFFAAEPGAKVEVEEQPGKVIVNVTLCPAIAHLKASRREIVPFFCQHCLHLGEARAQRAGLSFDLEGGGGSCRQTYSHKVNGPTQATASIPPIVA